MTQGGPANSTLTIVYYLYQKGFQRFQMGYGASLAWIVFALIFVDHLSSSGSPAAGCTRSRAAMFGRLSASPAWATKIAFYCPDAAVGADHGLPLHLHGRPPRSKTARRSFRTSCRRLVPGCALTTTRTVLGTVNMGRYMLNTTIVALCVVVGPDRHVHAGRLCLCPHQLPGPGRASSALPGHDHDPVHGDHDPDLQADAASSAGWTSCSR